MKSLHFLLTAILLGIGISYAQEQPHVTAGFDLGAGFNSNSVAPSVLYHEESGFHRLPWLKVGLGIRAWGYHSGTTNLYSQEKSFPTDSLKYRNVSATGISFVVGVNFRIWKVDLGANTDLAGFSFGSKRNGFYAKNTPDQGDGAAYYNKWVATSPVIFNMLPLVFTKSNGQSEVYARIWFTKKIGLKLGYTYGRIAYLTKEVDDKRVYLDHRQRRFLNTFGMPYAAVAFPLH